MNDEYEEISKSLGETIDSIRKKFILLLCKFININQLTQTIKISQQKIQEAVRRNKIAYSSRYSFYIFHLILVLCIEGDESPIPRFFICSLILCLAEFFKLKNFNSIFKIIITGRVMASIIFCDWILYKLFDPQITYKLLLELYHFNQVFYLIAAQFICLIYILKRPIPNYSTLITTVLMVYPILLFYPNSNHQILFLLKSFSIINFSLFLIFKHNRLFSYSRVQIFLMFLYLAYSILLIINHLGFIHQLDKIYNINYVYSVVLLMILLTLIWRQGFIDFVTKRFSVIGLIAGVSVLAYLQIDEMVFLIQSLTFVILVVVFYLIYQMSSKKILN